MAATSNRGYTYALDDSTHDTVAVATLAAALTAADGVSLGSARAFSSIVSAPSSRTISSGSMRCYLYAPTTINADGSLASSGLRWMKYTALDWTPTTGVRDVPKGWVESISGAALRIIWLPDAMTVSGGTGVVLAVAMSVERWAL